MILFWPFLWIPKLFQALGGIFLFPPKSSFPLFLQEKYFFLTCQTCSTMPAIKPEVYPEVT